MPLLQIVLSYLPLLLIAACVFALFRRTGHGGATLFVGAMPLIVVVFSLLATLVGERSLSGSLPGLWVTAAALGVLAFRPWPRGGRQE